MHPNTINAVIAGRKPRFAVPHAYKIMAILPAQARRHVTIHDLLGQPAQAA